MDVLAHVIDPAMFAQQQSWPHDVSPNSNLSVAE
jgi:hypothetical protein